MYTFTKKRITMTGTSSLGWHLGHGYVQREMAIKVDKWVVLKEGVTKPICICTSKESAKTIAELFNRSCS